MSCDSYPPSPESANCLDASQRATRMSWARSEPSVWDVKADGAFSVVLVMLTGRYAGGRSKEKAVVRR
jgi:hypothetical protein